MFLASIAPVSKYRLHIAPYGEGRFAIYDRDSLMATGSRARAEEAVRIWRAEIDAGQHPSMTLGVKLKVMNAEVVALRAESERWRAESERWRAEMEKWRAERDPTATGFRGRKTRVGRPWAVYAIDTVNTASLKVSDNSIILTLRAMWKEHPEWPSLPATDRALQMWVSQQRRPKK
jgi:hypothetical protein